MATTSRQATWSRVLNEFHRLREKDLKYPTREPGKPSQTDKFRRGLIEKVESITARPLIVYASACTTPTQAIEPYALMINQSDKIGFKTATECVAGPDIDVLIHSPGGDPNSAEALVELLRSKYRSVRFIIPAYAKSAATMMAMSGDSVLMSPSAELGPIDPQMITRNGSSPAEAILEQFEKAAEDLRRDPSKLTVWMPILSLLGPSLMEDCRNAIALSRQLVVQWLTRYMFAGEPDAPQKAESVAQYLSAHSSFRSHGRMIGVKDLQGQGVKATDLSEMDSLCTAVDELYCCLDIFFSNLGVFKIYENGQGHAMIRISRGGEVVLTPEQLKQLPSGGKKNAAKKAHR